MQPTRSYSLTKLRINSTSTMKKIMKEKLKTKNWMLFLPTRRFSPLKPVRLRERYRSPKGNSRRRDCCQSRHHGGWGQGGNASHEHGVWWITSDNPPWLLHVAEGERHTLQQTVSPEFPEDGVQQNKQPLVGRVKHSCDPSNQGGH
jgi:hypothetical protein